MKLTWDAGQHSATYATLFIKWECQHFIQTCYHRDKLPKETAEYNNDDSNDSHKCDDSTGQQSVKCDCLLDDEESDYHNNSSERHNPTDDHEQVEEDDKYGGMFAFI